ncbi:hypothetical protein CROQUDRAFT_95757 [Cronartium quercuum f. sp. fusiforme G11]|uniref:No apical meristem-associated C-terminal domain-containing protein n=1 Tax=Cronartium quercuum f. sp. fusiforme G11 TaxID=708437 RepID=A0A9P6NGR2_9BASI|nr:hypothetical protein CROQUDRAFT_95757 [Cronartium quercuum f. sp. fusiforme G11]
MSRNPESGTSPIDWLCQAKALYASEKNGQEFKHDLAWEKLRYHEKWMVPSSSQTVAATLDMKVPHASEFSTSSDSNDNNNQATPYQNQCPVGIKKSKRRLEDSTKMNTASELLEKDSGNLQCELTILATNESTLPDELSKQALHAMKQKIKEKYKSAVSRDIPSTTSSDDMQEGSSQNPSVSEDLLGILFD